MTASDKPNEIVIDTRGQVCPSTLLVTLQNLNLHKNALKEGRTILRIMTDHRHSTATIPNAVRNMGYEVVVNKQKGYYEIIVGLSIPSPEQS